MVKEAYLRLRRGKLQDKLFDEANEHFVVEVYDVSPGAHTDACRVQQLLQWCHPLKEPPRLFCLFSTCICRAGIGWRGPSRPVVQEDTAVSLSIEINDLLIEIGVGNPGLALVN